MVGSSALGSRVRCSSGRLQRLGRPVGEPPAGAADLAPLEDGVAQVAPDRAGAAAARAEEIVLGRRVGSDLDEVGFSGDSTALSPAHRIRQTGSLRRAAVGEHSQPRTQTMNPIDQPDCRSQPGPGERFGPISSSKVMSPHGHQAALARLGPGGGVLVFSPARRLAQLAVLIRGASTAAGRVS
jgi:hypothetical protein